MMMLCISYGAYTKDLKAKVERIPILPCLMHTFLPKLLREK